MKAIALVMFLAASGTVYYYYYPDLPHLRALGPAVLQARPPAKSPALSSRDKEISELELQITNLRIELCKELDLFLSTKQISGRSARSYSYVRNGRVVYTRQAIGGGTGYSYHRDTPELAEWITGPDFGLRRASELRFEILRAQRTLNDLRRSR